MKKIILLITLLPLLTTHAYVQIDKNITSTSWEVLIGGSHPKHYKEGVESNKTKYAPYCKGGKVASKFIKSVSGLIGGQLHKFSCTKGLRKIATDKEISSINNKVKKISDARVSYEKTINKKLTNITVLRNQVNETLENLEKEIASKPELQALIARLVDKKVDERLELLQDEINELKLQATSGE